MNDQPVSSVYVFISHSSQDKEFVRKLDASLASQGVSTFLDERDIKIGESIPSKIHEAISRSTHLIYVISKESVKSNWVQDELAAGKMNQVERDGYFILPVLIEEAEIPDAIRHVNYADFRNWRSPSTYMDGVSKILDALGIPFNSPAKPEVEFFQEYFELYINVMTEVSRFAGFVDGAVDADYMTVQVAGSGPKGDGARVAVKRELEGEGGRGLSSLEIKALIDAIHGFREKQPTQLSNIAVAADELVKVISYKSYAMPQKWEKYGPPREIMDSAYRLSLMLKDLMSDIISMSFRTNN